MFTEHLLSASTEVGAGCVGVNEVGIWEGINAGPKDPKPVTLTIRSMVSVQREDFKGRCPQEAVGLRPEGKYKWQRKGLQEDSRQRQLGV